MTTNTNETVTCIDREQVNRARERGLEIARRFSITRDGDLWLVPDPPNRTFKCGVVLHTADDECRCTCPVFEETWKPCCHIHAARFADRRERGERLPEPEYPAEVPPGAPAWITPDLMRETYRVWGVYYADQLTPRDALGMLIAVGQLAELG